MKLLLAIFLWLISINLSHAQSIGDLYLNVSINKSQIYERDSRAIRGALPGWEFGIAAETNTFYNSLTFNTGLNISQIRFEFQNIGASTIYYLSIPIQLKVLLPLQLYVKSGLRFDFKFGYDRARKVGEVNGFPGSIADGFAEDANETSHGWIIGGGRQFNFNGFKPWIEISYTKDFKNFLEYDPTVIDVYKYTGKVTVGVPLFISFK